MNDHNNQQEGTIIEHVHYFTICTPKKLAKAIGIPLKQAKKILAQMAEMEKLIPSMEYDPETGCKELHYHVSPDEEGTGLKNIDKSLR